MCGCGMAPGVAVVTIKTVLSFMFLTAMPVFFAWYLGPGLWSDLTIRSQGAVAAHNAKVVSAWCKPSQIIFADCDVVVQVEGAPARLELDFLAFAGRIGRQEATALRSASDPALVTTSLNLDALTSRLLAFVALMATMLGLLGLGLWVHVTDWLKSRPSQPIQAPAGPSRRVAMPTYKAPRRR